MTDPSDYVLYFPSIEFQNDNWVKSSLLYWDKIYRIVPENYKPKDSKLILEAQEKGLIRNIILDEKETETTVDRFLKFIEKLEFLPAGLESDEYSLVHEDKIDSRLYSPLEKIYNIHNKNGWFKFPKELANSYIFYLATAVAKNRGGFSMSTDNPDNWVMSSFFTENGNFNDNTYDRNADGYYSSLILDSFIPADLSNVSMGSIVEFLDDEKEQKERFRSKVSNFTSSLSKCQNQETVSELIEDHLLEIENAKNDLKNSMTFMPNLKSCFYTCLMTGIPLATDALEYFTGGSQDPFNYYSMGGLLTVGAVAAYDNFSQAKANKKQNNFASYLVDVDKNFALKNKKGVYFNLGQSFNEFVND